MIFPKTIEYYANQCLFEIKLFCKTYATLREKYFGGLWWIFCKSAISAKIFSLEVIDFISLIQAILCLRNAFLWTMIKMALRLELTDIFCLWVLFVQLSYILFILFFSISRNSMPRSDYSALHRVKSNLERCTRLHILPKNLIIPTFWNAASRIWPCAQTKSWLCWAKVLSKVLGFVSYFFLLLAFCFKL